MIDYKTLLEKYMRVVIDAEGISFVGRKDDIFTDEEYECLKDMADKIDIGY